MLTKRSQVIRKHYTPKEIAAWIDVLVAAGDVSAHAFGRDAIMYNDHFFTPNQLHEIKVWKDALPTFGQLRQDAKSRIAERIEKRREARRLKREQENGN